MATSGARAPATIPGPPRDEGEPIRQFTAVPVVGRRLHQAANSGPMPPTSSAKTLQAEYEAWRDGLPESLAESRTAELLKGVCDVTWMPSTSSCRRGFGRD